MVDISDIFIEPPVVIVAKSTVSPEQMGVTIQLGAVTDFEAHLAELVRTEVITEEEEKEYVKRHDGYQMLWTFDTPAVVKEDDGGIDAACITTTYGDGGFCAGITWKGVASPF